MKKRNLKALCEMKLWIAQKMLGWKALSLWSHQNTVYFQCEMQKTGIFANWGPVP